MVQFVSDPAIEVKIRKMKERVRWQEQGIVERGIDQTRLVLEGNSATDPEFSFLVIGDSGSGSRGSYNPQRQIAERMLSQREGCRFVLHTGDVIYLVGSSEYYPENFIQPYREFLAGGADPRSLSYDKMIFNLPFLPVPGNHDYYDLPLVYGILAQAAVPVRRLFRSKLDFDVGWHGSGQGNAYAKAFLDYLQGLALPGLLEAHLDRHYTGRVATGRCLRYQPNAFTRLPNRYYSFRWGGIDFFALDSNTFNAPLPLPKSQEGDDYRRQLEQRRSQLEQEKLNLLESANQMRSDESEQLDDLRTNLAQLDEVKIDIDKQLSANPETTTDSEQLDWLKQGLMASWQDQEVRGRVIYLHHPPYVTEATKWHQAQTLAVRYRLRQVFDAVAEKMGHLVEDRPVVDLVLSGHAHCLEYIRTGNTGHADSHTNWIVCGGSGHSLRRQRKEGPVLTESREESPSYWSKRSQKDRGETGEVPVAKCQLFVGRNGQGLFKHRPYSFLRVDVLDGRPPKFCIRPFVSDRYRGEWKHYEVEPFIC